MKIPLLLLIGLCVVLNSCQKKESTPNPTYGSVTATVYGNGGPNGTYNYVPAQPKYSGGCFSFTGTYNLSSQSFEQISLSVNLKATGTYILSNHNFGSDFAGSTGALGAFGYGTDSLNTGSVTFYSFDSVAHIAKGVFHYQGRAETSLILSPDSVANGSFTLNW